MTAQASAIARLFSSTVLKELARAGRSPLLARIAREASLLGSGAPPETVGSLFDYAFSLLKEREHRHEYVYKAALTEKVLLGTHSLRTASMITEFRVGQCKADVVILNGTGTVYEIKSERDSLSRLARQLEAYESVFPVANVIVGENHVEEVLSTVERHVGIMVLSSRYRISTVREARNYTKRLSPSRMLEALTMREAQLVLRELNVSIPHVPNTKRYSLLESHFETFKPTRLHAAIISVLKQTRSLVALSSLVETLPSSLHSLVLSNRLRKQDYARLVAAVSTPIEAAMEWERDGLSPVLSW